MDKEKEIQQFMKALQISRKEAEQLWLDDHEDVVTAEMAEMEKKAKQIKRYEKSAEPRKKANKERKVDETKGLLLRLLSQTLEEQGIEIKAVKTETEINFVYQNENYSLKLIKHRKRKEG